MANYLTTGQSHQKINVGDKERLYTSLAGGALAILGLRSRSLGGLAVAAAGGGLVYRALTGHCGLYQSLGVSSSKAPKPSKYEQKGIKAEIAYTIDRSAQELYAFWRDFTNLPKFMFHLQSVTDLGEGKTRWVASAPAGFNVQWDAEIISDEPGKLIAWRSLAGSQVDNAGSVRFIDAPEGRGTEVRVNLDYIPPAGTIGKWVAKLFGKDPQTEIEGDLYRFKNLMEAGEVPTIKGQSKGSKE